MVNTLTAKVRVPKWTNWLAVDKNGDVYAYENEPVINEWPDSWINVEGHHSELLYQGVPPKDYTKELYSWS